MKPWEQYQTAPADGPWTRYAAPPPVAVDEPATAPADPSKYERRFFGLLPPSEKSPETLKAIEDMKARPWGSGLPSVAYDAGGKVTDTATSLGASPEVAAGAGYAANVATQAIPALMTGKFVQEKAAPIMEAGARSLMQSAVKPTYEAQKSGDAAKAITTMLQEGYNPTKGGVQAMQKRISDLGDEITEAIKNSPAVINKNDVASRLNSALDKFRNQVNPKSDLKTIEDAWSEFLSHPDLVGKINMPVQLAQALKQGTYRVLGDKPYGELSGASTEAQKQLARGLKEEISAAVPGVAERNEVLSALINAKDIAQRRVMMSGNNMPGAGIGWLANKPAAALGFMAEKSDLVKALLARLMHQGAERVPQAIGGGVGAAVMAQTGRAPEISPQQQAIARALAEQQGGN